MAQYMAFFPSPQTANPEHKALQQAFLNVLEQESGILVGLNKTVQVTPKNIWQLRIALENPEVVCEAINNIERSGTLLPPLAFEIRNCLQALPKVDINNIFSSEEDYSEINFKRERKRRNVLSFFK